MTSLRTRALLVVVTLVVSLVMLALLVAERADGALKELDRGRFEAQTRQLADAVSYPVLARSAALLEEPVAAFSLGPDVVRVEVFDDAGALLLARAGPAVRADADVAVSAVVRTRAQAPGGDADPFAAALGPAEPRDVGRVAVAFSSRATERVQQRTRRSIVFAVGAVGGVGLIAALLLVTSVVRRLRALQAAAARVRAGDLGVRVVDDSADELSSLAHDFNAMTASLNTQSQQLAERESLAALGRATAVIAHELKNPLGIVLGAAEIVGNDKKPEAARREAAGIVVDETRRLAVTLDDLLAYAKPRAAHKQAVDVRAVCATVAERVALPGGPAVGRVVEVQGSSVTAVADASQLERALWNLVQNAAQAQATRVQLTVASEGARVVVRVADDGEGVPPAMREQLFVPFATHKQRGTGLGLAGARRALRDVGGDLHWGGDGLSGRGACFVITLERAP